MLDGAPDAVKVACPVLAGGKAGDNIKGLPIGTKHKRHAGGHKNISGKNGICISLL